MERSSSSAALCEAIAGILKEIERREKEVEEKEKKIVEWEKQSQSSTTQWSWDTMSTIGVGDPIKMLIQQYYKANSKEKEEVVNMLLIFFKLFTF